MKPMKLQQQSRRAFVKDGLKAAGGLALATLTSAPLISTAKHRIIGANDTIGVALIGANSMGFGNLSNAVVQPDARCIALCDVDGSVLARRTGDIEKQGHKKPANYKDYREMLENKDVDAVIIGTPDHWHCLPFLDACAAAKDVYSEKPMANSIAECNLMVKYARKYQRVAQIGQQQRSGKHWIEARDIVRNGGIGQLRKVLVWGNFNYAVGRKAMPDEPVPAGVDFDRWLGPAPVRTFNPSRFHGSWRFFWDYGGGLVTDWGVHLLDMALWIKEKPTTPLHVAAIGGNYSHAGNLHETFDTMSVVYQMADHTISWEQAAGTQKGPYNRHYGVAYLGNDATLVIDRNSYSILPESNEDGTARVPAVQEVKGDNSNHRDHMRDFLDCIKSRKDPRCTVEEGRLVALYAHMANIALRTRSALTWDEKAGNFGDNKAANALIKPVYRKPWTLPQA